jgi:pyrroloquinoline quinone biosynthesis protein D
VSAPRLAGKARLKWDRKGERYMLLYPERGMTLSETAAAILKKCDGERSAEAIAVELAAERGADVLGAATIRADVLAFLEEMRRRGLVEGP